MGWLEENGVRVGSHRSDGIKTNGDGFILEPQAVSMDVIKETRRVPVIAISRSTGERILTTQDHARLVDPNKFDFYMADTSGNQLMDKWFSPREQIVEGGRDWVPVEMGLSNRQQMARTKALALEGLGLAGLFSNPFSGLPAAAAIPARVLLAAGLGAGTDAAVRAGFKEPQNLDEMRGTALTYGGSQLVGEGLGLATKPLAEFFMHKALRPTRAQMVNSPTLIQDAIQLRTRLRKPGEIPIEAETARRAAGAAVENIISSAEAMGGHIPYESMERRLLRLREDISLGDPTGEATKALDDYIDAFRQRWGGGATPTKAQRLKRHAAGKASKVFRQESEGVPVDEIANLRARANQAVARDMRENLETMARDLGLTSPRGRTLGQENAAYQKARAVSAATTRAQEIAPSRLDNVLGAATTGAAVGKLTKNDLPGAMATSAAMMGGQIINSPQAYANYALLLSNPNVANAIRWGPTLLAPLSTTDLFTPTPAVMDR